MKLKVSNLSFSYNCFKVLNDINFEVNDGELTCLLGVNGAGKSTLFNCILNLFKNYDGRIELDGIELRSFNNKEIASKIAYVRQGINVNLSMSVLDVVTMGTINSLKFYEVPKEKQINNALKALELMEITYLKNRNFAHLSGGEKQLVLICRALAQDTKIILLDEPCSNLDYGNQVIVLKKLKQLTKLGYIILMTSHNIEHALDYADKVIVLKDGVISVDGVPSKVLTKDELEKLYGIDLEVYHIDGRTFVTPL